MPSLDSDCQGPPTYAKTWATHIGCGRHSYWDLLGDAHVYCRRRTAAKNGVSGVGSACSRHTFNLVGEDSATASSLVDAGPQGGIIYRGTPAFGPMGHLLWGNSCWHLGFTRAISGPRARTFSRPISAQARCSVLCTESGLSRARSLRRVGPWHRSGRFAAAAILDLRQVSRVSSTSTSQPSPSIARRTQDHPPFTAHGIIGSGFSAGGGATLINASQYRRGANGDNDVRHPRGYYDRTASRIIGSGRGLRTDRKSTI